MFTDYSTELRAGRAIQAACGLGIFAALGSGVKSSAGIALECQTKPDMTEKLLIVLSALGLLERSGTKWTATHLARTYLTPGGPLYQGNIIGHSTTKMQFWNNLESELLQPDARVEPRDSHRLFIMGMYDIAASDGRADALAHAVDLTGRRAFLDVGGGPGAYAMGLCRHYPGLRATVFDLPETIAIAREMIEKDRMTDSVSVREGDWNVDDFGEGYDVVLLSNVMHGSNSQAAMKLQKAHNAMIEGGLLIIQEFILNDEKTGPLIPAIFNLMLGAWSQAEISAEIEPAGFVKPRVVLESAGNGQTVIVAEKG